MNLLDNIDQTVSAILWRALEGDEISWEDGLRLCETNGREFHATVFAADELRQRQVGEIVTYVINRNVNFTNVCVKHCGFCAFSRTYRSEQGYFLPQEEILQRVQEAAQLGATEVCMQAGLPPNMDGAFYINLTAAVKKNFPAVHIHAFSPEEVLYGSTLCGMSIRDYLAALKAAG